MEDIREIVNTIRRGCAQGGLEVSEVLAAFVARTIVEKSTNTFALDKRIDAESKDEIIIQSIEKLLEKDNPQLETMKMQVDFDSSFLEEDNNFQKNIRVRKKLIATSRVSIAELEMTDGNDFESLTNLYRKIFRFLLEFTPTEKSVQDRAIEREVAAALESVFPRIGLKSFIMLNFDEKSAQLMELARIVLGIRLFNRHQGRGGNGIDNIDINAPKLARAMEREVNKEVNSVTNACNKYQSAIVKATQKKRADEKARKKAKIEEKEVERDRSGLVVNDWLLNRWSMELANRRQYLAFLRSLQEEINACALKVAELMESITGELTTLAGMVGGRAAVPKEQVYPKFDHLATIWINLWEEFCLLKARSNTYQSLKKYKNSYSALLSDKMYAILGGIVIPDEESKGSEEDDDFEHMLEEPESIVEALLHEPIDEGEAKYILNDDSIDTQRAEGKEDGIGYEVAESKHREDKASSFAKKEVALDAKSASGATLLSVDTTPGFMLLPLELQGFCPWTIAHANGLLVPGKPALGVIKYENLYYVCEHREAIKAFMDDPETHLRKVMERAQRNPEFIHLLRLQNHFPTASIARLIERPDFDATSTNISSKPISKDASTGTPTHFVEKHIDPNYSWNEWELRRRILKIVNLKKCATTSQQTDNSHFKRDQDTQVYLPRDKDTQTKREKGTNPIVKTTYIAGLRGKPEIAQRAVSKYVRIDKEDRENDLSPNQARVVTLTLEYK